MEIVWLLNIIIASPDMYIHIRYASEMYSVVKDKQDKSTFAYLSLSTDVIMELR